ncbi:MAG: DUF5777 family beta-barrel protein [Bacteroidota bacterium]
MKFVNIVESLFQNVRDQSLPHSCRRFFEDLSLQISPAYVRCKWAVFDGDKDLFAINTEGVYYFSELFSIRLDYSYFLNHRMKEGDFHNHLGIGMDFFTGLHIFHINFTNSTGIIPHIN